MRLLMETIQVVAGGQEELRQATLKVVAANPDVTLPVNTPVVTRPSPEGGPVN